MGYRKVTVFSRKPAIHLKRSKSVGLQKLLLVTNCVDLVAFALSTGTIPKSATLDDLERPLGILLHNASFVVFFRNAVITIITIRLRYDYDRTATYRARLHPIRRKQKWTCQFFVVILSWLYRSRIAIVIMLKLKETALIRWQQYVVEASITSSVEMKDTFEAFELWRILRECEDDTQIQQCTNS